MPCPADKYAGRGVKLCVDGMDICNFSSISSTGGEAERIDVTTHDTIGPYREFRPGFASEVTVTFDILWDPNDESHQHLAELFCTGDVVPVVICLATDPPAQIEFQAFVSALPLPAFPIDGGWTITVSMTLAGPIQWPGVEECDIDSSLDFGDCPCLEPAT